MNIFSPTGGRNFCVLMIVLAVIVGWSYPFVGIGIAGLGLLRALIGKM